MCCRASHSFADLVGTDLPSRSYREQHGHHRLLIETISVGRQMTCIGQPRRFPRPAKDRLRREAVAAVRFSGSPLTDLTPAAHPLGREPLKMVESECDAGG